MQFNKPVQRCDCCLNPAERPTEANFEALTEAHIQANILTSPDLICTLRIVTGSFKPRGRAQSSNGPNGSSKATPQNINNSRQTPNYGEH